LAAAPQIELEKIDWQVGVPPQAPANPGGAPAAGSRGAAPGTEGDRNYQVVELSGRVSVVRASDYRNITIVVEQFVEALRRLPGMQVISTRLPFDIAAEKSLAGDIGENRATVVPRFTIVAAKKLGS
jgi:hypothetical protein